MVIISAVVQCHL